MTKRMIAVTSLFTLISCASTPAVAENEYLTEVKTGTYQTTGSASDIMNRGATCIAQHTGEIANKDSANNVAVATIKSELSSFMISYTVRTTMTLSARKGRFRIKFQNIERMQHGPANSGFNPVGKWWGSHWEPVRDNLQSVANSIAECTQKIEAREDW